MIRKKYRQASKLDKQVAQYIGKHGRNPACNDRAEGIFHGISVGIFASSQKPGNESSFADSCQSQTDIKNRKDQGGSGYHIRIIGSAYIKSIGHICRSAQ